jgi:hypothetical protein
VYRAGDDPGPLIGEADVKPADDRGPKNRSIRDGLLQNTPFFALLAERKGDTWR